MTDVVLYQTLDDGDVIHKDGDLVTDRGIQTATYLSLFGGNRKDGSFDITTYSWWANFSETDPKLQYRSELQFILHNNPLIPSQLLRVEDAAKRDLQWLIDDGLVSTISVSASVPTVDTLQLDISLDELELIFVERIDG